jgi:endonuclease/exonuclease/phosphatase family metal-dependent hydrolase
MAASIRTGSPPSSARSTPTSSRCGLLDLDALERDTGLFAVPVSSYSGGHGWHGNALLYREAAVSKVRRLSLPGVEPRGALMVDLQLRGGALRIISAHLGLLRHSRTQQVKVLRAAAAQNEDDVPTVIVGDFNEWRVGARSSLRGFHPAFGPVDAALPSFPAQFPVLALDRVLASPHHLLKRIEVHDTPLARVASDHLPIKASISVRGAAATGDEPDDLAAA